MTATPEDALLQLRQHVANFARRAAQRQQVLDAVPSVAPLEAPLHAWEEALAGLRTHADRAAQLTQEAEQRLVEVEGALNEMQQQAAAMTQGMKSLKG
jgi:hypothetical protein